MLHVSWFAILVEKRKTASGRFVRIPLKNSA
jgi:hypothetical protein